MATPVCRPAPSARGPDRLWWLPSGGRGNGLDDRAWVPILEVSQDIVPALLAALAAAAVPAYAAPARPVRVRLRDRAIRPEGYQLWVGASAYGEAEAVLLAVMPRLSRQAAQRADHAWR